MKYKYYLLSFLLVALLLLMLPYAWELFSILFLSPKIPVLSQLELYKWAFGGTVAAIAMGRFFDKNLSWLETFSHELTHIIVALFFFRKVHSFHAGEDSGVVYTSGTNRSTLIPMVLAPYCLPIFTYVLLAFRSLISVHGMWIFDIFVGGSLAFHIHCFWRQTGSYQPDINQYPLFFSYLYIYVARLVNVCIITVAFFPHYNVFTSVWRLLCALYDNLLDSWIFLT